MTDRADRWETSSWTVRAWGEAWLNERERAGYRGTLAARSIWRAHVERAPWIDAPMGEVTRADARAWFVGLCATDLAAQTIRNVLNIVRSSFETAFSDERITTNPFRELRVPRTRAATMLEREWTTYALTLDEQRRLLEAMPLPERWIVQTAMGTGLRKGEQWSLRLSDLFHQASEPFMLVRCSRPGVPTKGGKPRHVPIFGMAREAIARWLEARPTYTMACVDLVFPRPDGGPRRKDKDVRGWGLALATARLTGKRWHDLRHTCGTSLVNGWWGRRWTLEEVQVLLGHASVQTTERYARLHHEVVMRAARETEGVTYGLTSRGSEGKNRE